MNGFIYGLADPRWQCPCSRCAVKREPCHSLFYVGKSSRLPEVRFGGHLQEALSSRERTRKNARILEILDAGLKPEVVILQEVPPGLLGIYEARWIYLYATGEFGGPGILNVTRPRLDADSAAFLLSFIHERVRLIDEHLAELRGGAVQ